MAASTYSNRLFPDHVGEPWHFYDGGLVNLVNFWSLHIEEQFYILWPLFVFFLRIPKRLLLVAAGISVLCLGLRLWLYAHGSSQEFIYTSLITRTDGLLLSACLALALRTRLHASVLKLATPVFITATILFIADLTLLHPGVSIGAFALFPLEFTLVLVAVTMLIAMCLKLRSRTAGIFRAPVLRFFGKYSYGLYIFHFVLPVFYVQYLKSMTQRSHSHALRNVINSLTELMVALVVSMPSCRCSRCPF